ncbi:NAD(P)-dependent oxidoreductase [Rhodococcoides corynebacterioides]|uniref:NAD(P)-dependent oxidoreductase n=1 Tax=Rhodococcoides corynebacterioides TaxID=53972 RepID=UPI003AE82383
MRVAVIGIGTMGAGMAASILRAGHDLSVWNRTAERTTDLVNSGARASTDPADCVHDADVVITMLYDEAATADSAAEFLPAMRDGAVWMQSATVGPAGARRLADVAARHDVAMLDAPVLGTKAPAEQGTLTALVSGPDSLHETVRPVLEAIAVKTVSAGAEPGAASALKLACNAMVATLTAATAQSVAIARHLGVDPTLFLQALDGGPIGAPYTQLKGTAMIEREFTPSFGVDGVVKDLDLMIDATDTSAGRLLGAVRAAFADASDRGHGSDDMASVIDAFAPPA